MTELIKTKDDAVMYLLDKRDSIRHMATQANDLKNKEGAKILRLAEESLSAAIRYVIDVPFGTK
jgi:hypothetical protein